MTITSPEYIRDGRFYIPKGVKAQSFYKHWYCVRHPDGSYRDALTLLYTTYDRDEQPVAVLDCPALEHRWEQRTDWLNDVWVPFLAAAKEYASKTLGLLPEDLKDLPYITIAWRGETRQELRDVPHMGNLRPWKRQEIKEVA